LTDNEDKQIAPDFEKAGGLIPAVAQDAATGEILMLAYMNPEALQKTISTGEAHYWSRSRRELWHKGGASGHVQKVREVLLDCDGDALVIKIDQLGGAACHTGHRTCFHFRSADGGFVEEGEMVFDPNEVYNK
jgi:phosphoribosyl-AMP cyclohydrolase